jgi:hypothetical protein
MTIQRFLLAFVISIVITFALAVAYLFYPLIGMLLREMPPHDAGNGGGAFAASGGIRSTTLLIVESVVFLIMLALLYRRRTNP